MRRLLSALPLLIGITATPAAAQGKYPPIADYLMPRDAEIALARSAAPPIVADRATVKVLTASGYEVARQGDNGVVCMVMRGFSAPTYTPAAFRALVYDPTVHAPICFAAPAVRTVLPYTSCGRSWRSPASTRIRSPRRCRRRT